MSSLASPGASGPMILRIKRKRGTDVPVDALYLQQALDRQAQAVVSAPTSGPTSAAPSASPSPAASLSPSPSPSLQLARTVQARADAHALRRVTKRRSSARLPLSPSTQALPTLADADTSEDVQAQQAAEQEQVAHEKFASFPSSRRASTTSSPAPPGSLPNVFRFAETMSSAHRSRAADQEMRKRVTHLQLLRRMEQETAVAPQVAVTPPTPSIGAGPAAKPRARQPIVPGAAMARNRLSERLAPQALGPGVHRVQAPASPRIIDIVVSEPQKKMHRKRQTPAQAQAQAPKQAGTDDVDSLGDMFKQMLIEHLKNKNETIPSDLVDEEESGEVGMVNDRPLPIEENSSSSESEDSDEDYVYDIYYRDDTPSRLAAAPDGASQVGLVPSQVAGRDDPMEQLYIDGAQSIAALQVPNLTSDDWAVLMEPIRYGNAQRPREDDDDDWWSSDEEFVDEDWDFSRAGANDLHPGQGLEGDQTVSAAPLSAPSRLEEGTNGVAIGPVGQKVRLARTRPKVYPGLEEWDEGEDEDSNEEDYYRNEYPEHELDEQDNLSDGPGMSSDSDFGY